MPSRPATQIDDEATDQQTYNCDYLDGSKDEFLP